MNILFIAIPLLAIILGVLLFFNSKWYLNRKREKLEGELRKIRSQATETEYVFHKTEKTSCMRQHLVHKLNQLADNQLKCKTELKHIERILQIKKSSKLPLFHDL